MNHKVLKSKAITHEGIVTHEKMLILHKKLHRKLLYVKNTFHEKLILSLGTGCKLNVCKTFRREKSLSRKLLWNLVVGFENLLRNNYKTLDNTFIITFSCSNIFIIWFGNIGNILKHGLYVRWVQPVNFFHNCTLFFIRTIL